METCEDVNLLIEVAIIQEKITPTESLSCRFLKQQTDYLDYQKAEKILIQGNEEIPIELKNNIGVFLLEKGKQTISFLMNSR